jgi:hypothetical protein
MRFNKKGAEIAFHAPFLKFLLFKKLAGAL